MNQPQSIKRSIGDKLLILGAHYNSHPELPESTGISHGVDDQLVVQLNNDAFAGLHAWVSTLTDVAWKAMDFRDPKWSRAAWHVFVSGTITVLPVTVWCSIPGDYADTSDAVIAKLSETAVAGVR